MLFSPGIYEHAAAMVGRSPWEVSRDGALLAGAHRTAWERYRHPLVVTGIDVYNLEPEAYGAVIRPPHGNNVPALSAHPCGEVAELAGLAPLDPSRHPRIAATLEAGRALLDACPGAEVRVPVCGPFALAIGLLGMNELLMAVIEEPGELADAFEHLFEGQANYLRAIADAGLCPIVFESGTTPPLLSVAAFETLEAPALKRLLDAAREITGQAPPCIVGGDAAPVAKALLEAGPGMVIAPSETDQAAFLETAKDFPGIHVRVNLPAAALLDPSFETVRAAAEKALALARGRPDTSVGCGVVPYEANPETVLKLRDFLAAATD